jgi:hypothetical protein
VTSRTFTASLVAAALATTLVHAEPHSKWTAPRTPDGQPDLQGYWNSETYTPFERPAELQHKAFFTPEEAEAYVKRRQSQFESQAADDIHYDNAIWQSEKIQKGASLRTSLVVDPPDGRIPALIPEAQKRVADLAAARRANAPHALDSVQNRPLAERCIVWPHEGPPMQPVGYNSNLAFVQGPGYVVVIQEMIHNARVIPLDAPRQARGVPSDESRADTARPHVGSAIQQYYGDARGHWEGDTLVVETTNFTDRTQFRNSTAALKVTERITRTGPDTIVYRATMEDPHTWTRPWTIEYTMTRTDDPPFEYACHEGNYGMQNILRAQRAAEAKAAQSGATK